MEINLDEMEIELLLQSLSYTRRAFEEYKDYPSEEFKRQRIQQVDTLSEKLTHLKRLRKRL